MPKLIVLFFGDEESVLALADAAADGARSVRFTEVDARRGSAAIGDYDGVVIVSPAGAPGPELAAFLHQLGHGKPTANTVFGLVGGNPQTLERVAGLGAIVVSVRANGSPLDAARQLGSRVAKMIGWVRHALGHEAEHHEHAHHGHDDHH